MDKFYYEYEFEENLIKLIKDNYSLERNEKEYFLMRFMIINDIDEIKKIDLYKFIDFYLNLEIFFKYSSSLMDNGIPKNTFSISDSFPRSLNIP